MKNYVFNPYVNKADQTWPSGRGIWYGDQGNALVLVNEQEHLKFITQQTGCDVNSAFRRLRYIVDMTEQLLWENAHEFSFDDDYGHLTSSPREIGTGFRVSINVRLPRLSQVTRRFQFEARNALLVKINISYTYSLSFVKIKSCPPTIQKYAINGRHLVKFFSEGGSFDCISCKSCCII
jgi:hypothetical protein